MRVLGLERGTVKLMEHQKEWEVNAKDIIKLLKKLLKDIAIDIQHIGSTAIPTIHSKPIIDIVIGVCNINDIIPNIKLLEQNDIIYRGEDVPGQLLFAMGNFESNIITHHIHIVIWNEENWINYINFRDYLNTFKEKALFYDCQKQKLAQQFYNNRMKYTENKRELINQLINEASKWKSSIL